jgi:hypothetical protein
MVQYGHRAHSVMAEKMEPTHHASTPEDGMRNPVPQPHPMPAADPAPGHAPSEGECPPEVEVRLRRKWLG